MSDTTPADLAGLYRETRERLADLISGLDSTALATPVPACPAWAVRDVVAHLAAIPQDAISGRLVGLPTEEYTAEQVTRFADVRIPDILAGWANAAPQFEEIVASFQIWPAVIDLATHEQDIRGAIGRPGGRDTDAIRLCTASVLSRLQVPVPLRVLTEDGEFASSPPSPADADREGADRDHADRDRADRDRPDRDRPDRDCADRDRADRDRPGSGKVAELTLRTSRFEAFRWRMGRRSRAQMTAMDWSGDPSAILDHLATFGPAASDIIE